MISNHGISALETLKWHQIQTRPQLSEMRDILRARLSLQNSLLVLQDVTACQKRTPL
jgi:chemotaxis signal transduction protein